MKFDKLLGLRTGKLKVVAIIPTDRNSAYQRFQCLCDCGRTISRSYSAIRASYVGKRKNNSTYSCGCDRRARHAKVGVSFSKCLKIYQRNAKKAGREWELTEAQFRLLTSSPCYYTGRNPSNRIVAKGGDTYVYNGIDRKDSSKGYTFDNCVPCCFVINRMKSDLRLEEFLQICREVSCQKKFQ
jgi:hypothetical protein